MIKRLFLALLLFLVPNLAFAVTPTVTGVSGTVATGQTITITGTNMINEETANRSWTTAQGDFEGSGPSADNFVSSGSYTTAYKLSGSKSFMSPIRSGGGGTCDAPGTPFYADKLYSNAARITNAYMRVYYRYNAQMGGIFNMLGAGGGGYAKSIYFTGGSMTIAEYAGESTWPTQMLLAVSGNNHYFPLPKQIQPDVWYCFELASFGSTQQLWMDGILVGTTHDTPIQNYNEYLTIGFENGCIHQASYTLPAGAAFYSDRFAQGTSRIYPSSVVEIGTSAVYHGGTYIYQEPVFLSDNSIQVKVTLPPGTGPFYLFVTNNKQEHVVTPFNLSGSDNGDVTKPSTTALPASGAYLNTQTISLNATDNVGVASTAYCWGVGCTPSTNYTVPIAIANGTLGYRSTDVNGNVESTQYSAYTITSTVTAPTILSVYPYGTLAYGTSSTVLGATTDKSATCKYGTNLSADYAGLSNAFSTTGGTTHSVTLTGLTGGVNYAYRVICTDGLGNYSAPAQTTFDISTAQTGGIILEEHFDNNSFASRGWYDETNQGTVVAGGFSGNCMQWAWSSAASKPLNGNAMRRQFDPTEEMYLTYYVKFQSTWRGSQQTYHPHTIYLLSDLESEYSGLSLNYLTLYSEFFSSIGSPYNIYAQLASQDSLNVNTSLGTPPNNITATTENRSVNYCNGYKTGQDQGQSRDCYNDGDWYSATTWRDTNVITKDAWHKVTVRFKMNTVTGGVANADGIMQEWIDDVLRIDKSTIVYRTNQHATMKWDKIVLAPYMGAGSPIAQTMWVDELSISTNVTGSDPTPLRYILKLNAIGSGGQIYLAVPN